MDVVSFTPKKMTSGIYKHRVTGSERMCKEGKTGYVLQTR
jgi:hypothetical protein